MKKTKVKFLIIGLVFGIALGAAGICAALYAARGEVDWRAYIEDVLLPNAVTALVTLGVVGVGVKPAINSVLSAAASFVGATASVRESAEEKAESTKRIEESREEFSRQSAENAERIEALSRESGERISELTAKLERAEQGVEDIKAILKLGFGCMDELVKKGSAKRIMKVGESEDGGDGEDGEKE